MKKLVFLAALIIIAITFSGCSLPTPAASATASLVASTTVSPAATTADATVYKDGTYEYAGQKDGEGYFVKGKLTVTGGKIASTEWAIYDTNRKNKVFDKDYEAVFAGHDEYIQQCRDNLKGMESFESDLVKTQDVDEVDAITGATWAFNKFSEFVKGALKQAVN